MKVLIIGGGAAGMMAALSAVQTPGNTVTLLERQARLGRKLLATGNGRCNLTNANMSPEHYHGRDPGFVRQAMLRFGQEQTLSFFRSLGLLTVQEPSGRVYPLSDQANSVLDVLRFALEQRGVQVVCGCEVIGLKKKARGYEALAESGDKYFADRLIVTCGGCAGGKLGGVKSGYTLLSMLGHSCTPLRPSLMPIRTEPDWVRPLKGVRADAAVRLRRDGQTVQETRGEVQFTETGLSGPAAFELSRQADAGDELLLDLLRGFTQEELLSMLQSRQEAFPQLPTEEILSGMLHPRLGKVILRRLSLDFAAPISAVPEETLRKIIGGIRYFSLPVLGGGSMETAQVTAGGVPTKEFDPRTLESRLAPGVFAAGEVLDIDGDCGGYNLQWAWSSGCIAGKLGTEDEA